jgi:hypothetical protein
MKNIIILLTFLCAITSYAVAPYGIKGQQQAATLYSNVHQFPNNQVTNLGGINALVETGNTNILSNPSFEHSTFSTSWTNSAGTFTQETSVVIDGKASAKLVLAAQTMSLTQSSTLYAAQFADGVQGLAMVRIKSDIALKVCSIQAGTVSTTNCVTTATDSKWGLYKIPFILGATSNGVSIASSGSVTGTVYIDDAYVGAASIVQDAVSIQIQTGIISQTSTITTGSTVTGAFTGSSGSNMFSYVSGTGIYTVLKDGIFNLSFSQQAATAVRGDASILIDGVVASRGTNDAGTTSYSSTSGSFKLIKNQTFQFRNDGLGSSNVQYVQVSATSAENTNIYSSQCGANCVDTFSAVVSATDVVTNENIDWINGNCTDAAAGNATCVFKSNIFTVAPNCTMTPISAGLVGGVVSITSTDGNFRTINTAGAYTNGAMYISCQKQGADFVATRTIQGSFNEVVTSPGISKPVRYSAYVAGATEGTVCSTGSCTITKDSGSLVSSVAFSSTGRYTFTSNNGKFKASSKVTCWPTKGIESAGFIFAMQQSTTLTDANGAITSGGGELRTLGATGTAANTAFWIICEGEAP